jgi:hypothetical protein
MSITKPVPMTWHITQRMLLVYYSIVQGVRVTWGKLDTVTQKRWRNAWEAVCS